jgi:hypothetical protein
MRLTINSSMEDVSIQVLKWGPIQCKASQHLRKRAFSLADQAFSARRSDSVPPCAVGTVELSYGQDGINRHRHNDRDDNPLLDLDRKQHDL